MSCCCLGVVATDLTGSTFLLCALGRFIYQLVGTQLQLLVPKGIKCIKRSTHTCQQGSICSASGFFAASEHQGAAGPAC